ncbi:MAG: acyl-CoA dehydrogenase [Lysobacteraceae bacterium]|nr:MAG: acyl-CoA dehydrogenase [Xanthomonadaceae bacterium]
MNELAFLLSLVATLGAIAVIGVPRMAGSITMAAVALAWTVFGSVSWWLLAPAWLLIVGIGVVLNHKPFRMQYLSSPMFEVYKKIAPALSDTEAVALESGTVAWEGELFTGNPNFKKLRDIAKPELTAEERAFLEGPVVEVCRMTDDWKTTHELADLTEETWQFLKDNRFFGMIIPKKYGGLEFSAYAHARVIQMLASRSTLLSTHVCVPNSLGPAELLLHYGTEEQKNHYLPRLARGEDIPCFGLTAPTAGSDATSIPDTGVVCKGQWNGKEVTGIRLNFDKRYITLAPVATVVGIAFQLQDPDGLLDGEGSEGISLVLIPRDTKGMEIGSRHFPLNVPFQNGPIVGKDVFVPLDALIGGEKMAGQGWRMLVECLSVGRAISLPATAAGGMKIGSMVSGAYSRIRRQFNLPIGRFEGVEEALARIAGNTYATTALSEFTAAEVDRGERPAVPGAIAKYHCTEMGRKVAQDAMDIHGGKGIILGPKNYLGRSWQASPIMITVEGANIMTRSLMIFGQGAVRCHPWVLKEMVAARMDDPSEALKAFDHAAWGHIGHTFSNVWRSLWYGLTGARLARVPGDKHTRKHYRRILRYSSALALTTDVAMAVLGGKLKFKEKLSARLGDVLSQLYMASTMLKHFEDQGSPAADRALLNYSMEAAFAEAETALDEFIRNFPSPLVAFKLRALIFPAGRWQRQPSDRLGHKAAAMLISPNETRERLIDGCYRSAHAENLPGLMEQTLANVIVCEPLERRISKALRADEIADSLTPAQILDQAVKLNLINDTERALIESTRQEVAEIIAVDDFDTSELQANVQPGTRRTRAAA